MFPNLGPSQKQLIRPGGGPVVKPDFGPLLLFRVEALQKEAADGQGNNNNNNNNNNI